MSEGVIARASELAAIERFLSRGERRAVGIPAGGTGRDRQDDPLGGRRARRPTEHGITVLTTTPTRSESSIPLAGFWDLFADVEDGSSSAPAPQRRAHRRGAAAHGPRTEADGVPDRRALAVGTAALLRAMAARGPVLLAIDDVQWLDDGSAAMLAFALRRMADAPGRRTAGAARPAAATGTPRDRDGRAAVRTVHPGTAPAGGDPPHLRRPSRPPIPPAHAGQDRAGVRRQPVLRAGARPRADPLGGGDRARAAVAASPRRSTRSRRSASPACPRRRARRSPSRR